MGQAPCPTGEPVPALPELASAPREEALGLPKRTGFMKVGGYCTLLSLRKEENLTSFIPAIASSSASSFYCHNIRDYRVRSVIPAQAGGLPAEFPGRKVNIKQDLYRS